MGRNGKKIGNKFLREMYDVRATRFGSYLQTINMSLTYCCTKKANRKIHTVDLNFYEGFAALIKYKEHVVSHS